jgi:TusA-related sulfurtransferase
VRARALALLLPLALAGCPEKKTSTNPPAPQETVASAHPTPPPPAAASAAIAAGKMAHCPGAAAGASTMIRDVEGGVEIVVTGKDPASTKEIRDRAKDILTASKNQGPKVHHSGNGEGGGVFGRCPVVMRDTTIDVADIDNGTKITVKPENAKELDWLRREARERQASLSAPNANGAGRGKMSHCPSAVDGAKTKVADAKDGVTVTVTAAAADATKEIRDRAKHVAQVAKDAPKATTHDGEGHGGGGLGRCPVVLANTTIDEKDVEGGVVFTVKAKTAGDANSLRQTAKDRAERFTVATK